MEPPTSSPPGSPSTEAAVRRQPDWQKFRSLFVLLLMFVIAASLSDRFLTSRNLIQVVSQNAMVGILAVGMTFVVLTAGIDLSVGSTMLCSGVITAGLLKAGHPTGAATVACLAIGAGLGLVNGILITWLRLPSFIATLAMMVGAISIGQLYSSGSPIIVGDAMPASFQAYDLFLFAPSATQHASLSAFPGIPVAGLIFLGVAVVAHVVLTRTRYGRYVYALGGNREASRLSGINTRALELSVYVLAGLLAGIAALIYTARQQSGQALYGQNFELDAIAACVIGGASLFGGVGSIGGTVIGVLFVGILINLMQLRNVDPYLQGGLRALAIVLGVLIQTRSKK